MRLRKLISRCAFLSIAIAPAGQARAETPANGAQEAPAFVPVVWKSYAPVNVPPDVPADPCL